MSPQTWWEQAWVSITGGAMLLYRVWPKSEVTAHVVARHGAHIPFAKLNKHEHEQSTHLQIVCDMQACCARCCLKSLWPGQGSVECVKSSRPPEPFLQCNCIPTLTLTFSLEVPQFTIGQPHAVHTSIAMKVQHCLSLRHPSTAPSKLRELACPFSSP